LENVIPFLILVGVFILLDYSTAANPVTMFEGAFILTIMAYVAK
jgi:hypothetical protein